MKSMNLWQNDRMNRDGIDVDVFYWMKDRIINNYRVRERNFTTRIRLIGCHVTVLSLKVPTVVNPTLNDHLTRIE